MDGGDLTRPYTGGFDGCTHLFALRVYFEDTDTAGIVYHANYLRYLERARSDMLRAAEIDQRAALDAGEGVYAVTEMQVKWRRPARLDDALVVESRLVGLSPVTSTIRQTIRRGDEYLFEARVVAAFLSPDGRPRRQPAAWTAAFQPLLTTESPA